MFALTGHACRRCLGRILQAGGVFQCSVCGLAGDGGPEAVCGCGIALAADARRPQRRFRCVPNPAPSEVCPAEVVISLVTDESAEMPAIAA